MSKKQVSFTTDNMPIYGRPITLAAAGARTATGNGATIPCDDDNNARMRLAVTAASGTTPTMTVTIQTSRDNTNWNDVGSFPAVTGTTVVDRSFGGLDRYVRARWVIGGTTPSFNFSVAGELV